MLILTREVGETLRIHFNETEHVDITLCNISNKRVKIGIGGGKKYQVDRLEILDPGAAADILAETRDIIQKRRDNKKIESQQRMISRVL